MDATRLIETARKWALDDPDEKTASALKRLIDGEQIDAVRMAMEPKLQFGTAGLRGAVGPGPARMNAATISTASWALGSYLREQHEMSFRVIVGYDARPDSERFARLCAEVLAGVGAEILLGEEPLPTPVIACLVRREGAQAGVVVTASHNPRGDNGFKVFDGDGVQIVSPWDEEVARRIELAPAANKLEKSSASIKPISVEMQDAYFADLAVSADELVPLNGTNGEPQSLAYTPIHGVGLTSAQRVLEPLQGSVRLSPVPEQEAPDGTFPTAPFPNPEEPGVMDLLLKQAVRDGSRAACAHDPDADRFSLCLPLGGPELVRLSGDALGLLFMDACLKNTRVRNPEVISTIVSSPGATLLAERYGAKLIRTLTGFKWLCHAALESEAFLFAYEEALGYCFGGSDERVAALDKDGLMALGVAARLLVHHGGGEALADHLLSLYQDIGLWGSFGHSRRFDGPEGGDRLATQMDRLRESPDAHLGGLLVTRRVDYREGAEQRTWYLGAQDLVRFDLEPVGRHFEGVTSGRVFVRPSGTEAKLKAYVHLCSELPEKAQYAELSAQQAALAGSIARQVLRRPESILPSASGR